MGYRAFLSLFVVLAVVCLAESAGCPAGWTNQGSYCYTILPEHVSWYEAVVECGAVKGELVEINSQDENNFILSLLKGANEHYAWIGLQDLLIEGQFVWNSNATLPVYTNYHSGQPDDNGSGADCVSIRNNGEWYDEHCHSDLHATVCQTYARFVGPEDVIG